MVEGFGWVGIRTEALRSPRRERPTGRCRPERAEPPPAGAPPPCGAGVAHGSPAGRSRLRTGLAAALAATGVAAPATLTAGAGDLGGGEGQGRTDLVDLELDDGALLALAGLVGALLQPTLHHDTHAALQGLGDVLGRLPPHRAGEEQRVAVLPLVGLTVEGARRRRDPEVRHGRTRGGEAQLRVVDEVADHRDDGLACHESSLSVGSDQSRPTTFAPSLPLAPTVGSGRPQARGPRLSERRDA